MGHAESIADVFLTVLGWGFNSFHGFSEVLANSLAEYSQAGKDIYREQAESERSHVAAGGERSPCAGTSKPQASW